MNKYQEALYRIAQELGCDPAYYDLGGEFELLERTLTTPTSEQVCEALSEYLGKTVNYIDSYKAFVVILAYKEQYDRHQIIVEIEGKGLRFNNKLGLPALPPHIITMIGRFYEVVIANE